MRRYEYEDRDILCLGSGPSVNDFNVNDLQRFPTIGCNQIARRLDCDYVSLFDGPERFGEGMLPAMRALSTSKVLVSDNHGEAWTKRLPKHMRHLQRITFVDFNPAQLWKKWDRRDYIPTIESWDEPAVEGKMLQVPYGPTSLAICVWIAAYMGAKRVGLIGADLGSDYFFDSVVPFATKPEVERQSNHHWGSLGTMVSSLTGTGVYQLSKRSLIDTIPKANLDEWIDELE